MGQVGLVEFVNLMTRTQLDPLQKKNIYNNNNNNNNNNNSQPKPNWQIPKNWSNLMGWVGSDQF